MNAIRFRGKGIDGFDNAIVECAPVKPIAFAENDKRFRKPEYERLRGEVSVQASENRGERAVAVDDRGDFRRFGKKHVPEQQIALPGVIDKAIDVVFLEGIRERVCSDSVVFLCGAEERGNDDAGDSFGERIIGFLRLEVGEKDDIVSQLLP